jgi:hypothetical protein
MVIACGAGQTEADPAFSQLHTTTATHRVWSQHRRRLSPASSLRRENVFEKDAPITRRKQCITSQAAISMMMRVTRSPEGDDFIFGLATRADECERL